VTPIAGQPLKGRRVLIVEDQFLIAEDMRRLVNHLGGEVIGPVPDVARSHDLLRDRVVDVALLDINLDGEDVYSLALELRRRGVPVIFATGYDESSLPDEFRDAPQIVKPVIGLTLVAAVEKLGLEPGKGQP
jgi:DNA-binding LytR/AlgR family response regulator